MKKIILSVILFGFIALCGITNVNAETIEVDIKRGIN